MNVLITYDVCTETLEGKRRLRRIAKACSDFGQRVQFSVFECLVDPAQWVRLKDRLIYYLGSNWRRRVEHLGAKAAYDPEGPLIL
jgi:CRISPR-associated protein Cas2